MPKRSYSSYTTFSSPTPGIRSSRRAYARSSYKRIKPTRVPFKGYMRTAGFYGRYSGSSPELKFFDTALSFAIDTTVEVPATGQLSLIPQGVTQSTRVGRKATIKSIYLHGTAALVPAAAASPINWRASPKYLWVK